MSEKIIRSIIKRILMEATDLDPSLLGNVAGAQSIVLGANASKYLMSKGMNQAEIKIVFDRINNMSIVSFNKYDEAFKTHAAAHGLKPSLLKAMSIEETTLGKNLKNLSGSTAAGIIQITKPTLDTLNANLPAGVHYDYNSLLSDPALSIKIAAHYIKDYLIGKLGLKDRASILRKYKTGADASNYAARVEAFKKFIDAVGL
jgi:hypothetical protein